MKKVHINESQETVVNEDAKIISLSNGLDLSDDSNEYSEEEQKAINFVTDKYETIINELFELRETINEMNHTMSHEAYDEVKTIGEIINKMIDGILEI